MWGEEDGRQGNIREMAEVELCGMEGGYGGEEEDRYLGRNKERKSWV